MEGGRRAKKEMETISVLPVCDVVVPAEFFSASSRLCCRRLFYSFTSVEAGGRGGGAAGVTVAIRRQRRLLVRVGAPIVRQTRRRHCCMRWLYESARACQCSRFLFTPSTSGVSFSVNDENACEIGGRLVKTLGSRVQSWAKSSETLLWEMTLKSLYVATLCFPENVRRTANVE